ncbi:MAG: hypothetical protein ACPGXK_16705, partial [Phycisphaerae bacterium]
LMSEFSNSSSSEEIVQANTMPAAFSAGFMILCGYFLGYVVPQQPSDVVDFMQGWFVYALRIGGLGMVVTAVICAIGHHSGLVLDAVIGFLVGVILILTGLAVMVTRGIGIDALWLMIGLMLVTNAFNRARDYTALIPTFSRPGPEFDDDADMLAGMQQREASPSDSVGSQDAESLEYDDYETVEDIRPASIVAMDEKEKVRINKRRGTSYDYNPEQPISLAELGSSPTDDDTTATDQDDQTSPGSSASDTSSDVTPGGGFLADLGNNDR